MMRIFPSAFVPGSITIVDADMISCYCAVERPSRMRESMPLASDERVP